MARKTFPVADLLAFTNGILAEVDQSGTDVFSVEYKKAAIDALVHVLHATGQYAGFRYLDSYDANDPEFAIENGRKNFRRAYFMFTANRNEVVKLRPAR